MTRARLTWLGHATALIDLDRARLLTDPVLRRRVAHIVRTAPGFEPDPVDAVLLSHAHYDHLDLPTLRALGLDVRIVAPRGLGAFLAGQGFTAVEELAVGAAVEIDGVRVVAVPAAHPGGRPPRRVRAEAIGFVVEGSRRIYFAGDTDLFDGMAEIARGGLDAALLPVAGWGPRVPAGHLDADRAATAAARLAPGLAVPIHWGTYATAVRRPRADGGRAPADAFARLTAERAPATRVVVLEPGGSVDVPAAASGGVG